MESKSVTLMIRYKDADGKWKRKPVARGANGRVKPDHAQIDGKAVAVKGGAYELRRIVVRQPVYVPAGKRAADADAQRARLERTTAAIEAAKGTDVQVIAIPGRKTLKETAAAYISDAQGRNANEAAEQARLVSTEFIDLMRKRNKAYIDEIDRDDIFGFHTALRKRGCEDRTVANKHARLASWLRFGGIDKAILPPVPRYEEKLPTIYSSEQTKAILAAADPVMKICILLGLKTGLRDQELMHLEFRDINWKDKTLRVQSKEQWGFLPKTWEQREIPIPDDLVAELAAWQKTREGQELVLGTKNHKPNTKLLRTLKRMVHRAGLSCGRCKGCKEINECKEFTLHRLRRTYLTVLLRNGIDLRTVQAYAGHKDLASTMRYLRPASAKEAQSRLNAVQW
jgi:integrase